MVSGLFCPRTETKANWTAHARQVNWHEHMIYGLPLNKQKHECMMWSCRWCRYETTIKLPISTVNSLDQKGKHMHNSVLIQDIYHFFLHISVFLESFMCSPIKKHGFPLFSCHFSVQFWDKTRDFRSARQAWCCRRAWWRWLPVYSFSDPKLRTPPSGNYKHTKNDGKSPVSNG